MQKRDPIALIILDGFGYTPIIKGNALVPENIPMITNLFNTYPATYLKASSEAVGLPPNTEGNSEAGHLAIGTGQHILQSLTVINQMINDTSLQNHKKLCELLETTAKTNKNLHIMGLASNGNVHGSIHHMLAFISVALRFKIKTIIIHAFLDGRDTLKNEAGSFLKQIDKMQDPRIIIGSIHGRFYAMDRDNNTERTQKTYSVLTEPTKRISFQSWQEALKGYYGQNIYDEYIPPTALAPDINIKPGDLIINTNIRPERSIQLLSLLCNHKDATIFTAIEYEKPITTIPLTKNPIITHCLKMSLHNTYKLTITTIAETEKWAHVTYFFDGYCSNRQLANETRIHIPSVKVRSYVTLPEMSALQITHAIQKTAETNKTDFFLVNYANTDMVGHTADFDATVSASKIIDQEIAKLYQLIVKTMNGTLIITGDHGNAEYMIDKATNMPTGKHSTNPVPFIVASKKESPPINNLNSLVDIASYIELLVQKR